MRAWQAEEFGEPLDNLRQVDLPRPIPRDKEVLIEVSHVGLGLPDLMAVRGHYPAITKPPVIPGHSLAGRISAAGLHSGFNVGDRVMARSLFRNGTGALAEHALARHDDTFLAPTGLDDPQAAAFVVPYHTAHVGIWTRGRIKEGETLLVLGGSGGSGAAAIQLGKALGATVIAAARSATKTGFCKSQGADHVIDASVQHIGKEALALTGGRGVDVIFDPVGGEYCSQALEGIAVNGRLVLIGFARGWPQLDAFHIIKRQYGVIGAAVPARSPEEREEARLVLDRLANEGVITVAIESISAFDRAPDLIAGLGGDMLGKHVVSLR